MAANDDGTVVPILCMCRLCLNYSQDCSDSSNLIIRNQIKKYLSLEVNRLYKFYLIHPFFLLIAEALLIQRRIITNQTTISNR